MYVSLGIGTGATEEPAERLDAAGRRDLIRRLSNLATGRMVLVVSHRAELATWADRVVVLANGQICEQGAAGTLLEAGGEFARLFRVTSPPGQTA